MKQKAYEEAIKGLFQMYSTVLNSYIMDERLILHDETEKLKQIVSSSPSIDDLAKTLDETKQVNDYLVNGRHKVPFEKRFLDAAEQMYELSRYAPEELQNVAQTMYYRIKQMTTLKEIQ